MALVRADGSVYSENTPSREFEVESSFFGIYKAILTNVRYVDDSKNMYSKTSTPQVVYDGVLIGSKAEGQAISNIKDGIGQTGEVSNFGESIYRVCSKPFTGSNAVPLNKQDGAIVYVAFIYGNPSFPVIVGRDKSALDRIMTGATKAEGPRKRWQYNGLFFEINKLGELIVRKKGGKYSEQDGIYLPNETGNEVFFKWSSNKLELNIGSEAIKEVRDGVAELVTLQFKSGLSVTYDGKNDAVSIVTKGGARASVDGKTGTIQLKDNSTGALKLANGKVAIGASSAELLQQISDSLQALITLTTSMSTETHLGNLGYPTAPPTNAADYLSAKASFTSLKGLIDGIKGIL